jgi:dsDNA-specific endonuclease/ATPase MutS2
LLRRLPYVVGFSDAPGYLGGWGATVVGLAAIDQPSK